MVALGYYQWNVEINRKVHDVTKFHNPSSLTVGGDPDITSINANEKGAIKFFSKQKKEEATI